MNSVINTFKVNIKLRKYFVFLTFLSNIIYNFWYEELKKFNDLTHILLVLVLVLVYFTRDIENFQQSIVGFFF